MDDQLETIRNEVKEAVKFRNCTRDEEHVDRVNKSSLKDTKNLQTGDIFITKHSNLSQVHVVFHLVCDDSSLRSGDINSRYIILHTSCIYFIKIIISFQASCNFGAAKCS